MKHKVTQFARKLSDSWRLTTFWRRLSEKSKDRNSPKTSLCSTDDDDSCSPCPLVPTKQQPTYCPCPPILLSTCPEADPGKHKFWRAMSLFVAIPVVLITSIITCIREKEKRKQPREPYLNLPYMQRRTKPFPWGDGNHTLFHNPVKNPIPPHGYEVEDPNAIPEKKKDN
ncbi:cytochrome c oxidase subunit 6A1, mitochondrial-like [Pseudomyrmex gracilis]|uniref:cytochrome c oxidase subunit 6A1, mitochondrial-like n=1 Tax=Pseudomyrmex gracilis TaxID=219809 RepID=UPI00099584AC|nr:cytochrome c oxidase subunit 6A1, mitochondrial-like [Pseudomyrmex gracilis]